MPEQSDTPPELTREKLLAAAAAFEAVSRMLELLSNACEHAGMAMHHLATFAPDLADFGLEEPEPPQLRRPEPLCVRCGHGATIHHRKGARTVCDACPCHRWLNADGADPEGADHAQA